MKALKTWALLLYKKLRPGQKNEPEKEKKTMAEEQIKNPDNQDGGELTFDEILEDKTYQSEFDKRVSKALETAKAKWEKAAEADKTKAVTDATTQLNAELTKALIHTELVKAKARDVDVVMPLIDTAKVTRTENGLEGLEEQIKTLQEGKSYLFEAAQEPSKPKGKTGLNHEDGGDEADDAKIRRIMGLPTQKG